MSLASLSIFLLPLIALLLSYDAIVGERERNTLGLLLSMPVGRTEVIVGKFVGRALALCLAVRDRAGAAMLAAASAITQTEWRRSRREGRAPADAIVQDVMFREGEYANPNQPIVSLLPPRNIKVRFFVPEAELGHIEEGGKVRFACSDCPENATGTIRFISSEAEFTPPVIYSDQSKEKLVYMAEATPDDNPEAFHPGQPVTVSLPAQQTE